MKNKRKIFFQILYSYIMILLVPLISIAVIYGVTNHAILKNTKHQVEVTLSTVADMVEMRTAELRSISSSLEKNQNIWRLLDCGNIHHGMQQMYELYKLTKELPDYSATNSMVKNVQVVLKNGGYLLSPGSAIPHTEKFFSVEFPGLDMDYETFQNQFVNHYYNEQFKIVKFKDGHQELWYLHTIMLPYSRGSMGLIIIQINQNFFDEILERVADDSLGAVIILNEDGDEITAQYRNVPTNQENYPPVTRENMVPEMWPDHVIASISSDKTGWTYYHVAPKSGIVTGLEPIRAATVLLLAVTLLAGAAIAIGMSRVRAESINKVMESLDSCGLTEPNSCHNAYAYMEAAARKLTAQNLDLSTDIRQQKELLHASCLQKLLNGEYQTHEEQQNLLKYVQLPVGTVHFRVLLIQNRQNQEKISDRGLLRMCQKKVLSEILPHQTHFFDTDERRLTVLIWSPYPQSSLILQPDDVILEGIRCLEKEYGICSAAVIGDIHTDTLEISQAYQETLIASDYLQINEEQKILHLSDLPNTQTCYYYPLQLELEFLQAIGAGNEEKIREIGKTLYMENFSQRQLSASMLCQLNSVIKGSLFRGMKDFLTRPDAEMISKNIYMAETLEDIMESALELSRIQSREVLENPQKSQNELKQRIIDFIKSNYSNSNLSVARAAEELGIGESALYQFFRENMTTTFADMLECERIHAACDLLKAKKHSIKSIAEQVGYNSDTTFRRAFKRVMHLTPGEYLNSAED